MLRLPLESTHEICIFGKNISVYRRYETKVIPMGDGEDHIVREVVTVEDGTHGNGGWRTTMKYEDVICAVQKHINGEI